MDASGSDGGASPIAFRHNAHDHSTPAILALCMYICDASGHHAENVHFRRATTLRNTTFIRLVVLLGLSSHFPLHLRYNWVNSPPFVAYPDCSCDMHCRKTHTHIQIGSLMSPPIPGLGVFVSRYKVCPGAHLLDCSTNVVVFAALKTTTLTPAHPRCQDRRAF